MKTQTVKKSSAAVTVLIMLAFTSLACGIRALGDGAGPSSQQQTREGLSQTQTTLDDVIASLRINP